MKQVVSGYGTWKSPLTAARVTAGALRFDHLVVDGDDLYWSEGRASEAGRYVVVRRTPDGRLSDVTPDGFNVRSRLHEYGGAAYTVHEGTVYFSNFADQRVYRQAPGRAPDAITAEGCFYADAHVDPRRDRLLCVREDHRGAAVINTIVSVAIDGRAEHVLVSGADFYSDPALSRDGSRLAWLQWNHPSMPWDGTRLWVAEVDGDGTLGPREHVAGGDSESIFQPEWAPDGTLIYASDRTGWWNLYRWAGGAGRAGGAGGAGGAGRAGRAGGAGGAGGEHEALAPMAAEFGKPQWVFSQTTFCFLDATRIAATYTEEGRWKLGILDLDTRRFDRIDLSLEPVDCICATSRDVFFIGGSPTHPPAIARVVRRAIDAAVSPGEVPARPPRVEVAVIRAATADRISDARISPAQPVTFDSSGQPVHAFYYPPKNPDNFAPDGELPPLMVMSHGGPTAASTDVLDARIQFWTSRGFAVLDVNYSGSTGFGRAYRDRLKGRWGLVDVTDCVNGAAHLVARGQADPDRLIIRGGSAGGYTTLAALTFHDTFKAGASHYGVSDVEVLAQDTHKFESRYLDSLIGPYPEARDLYRARSPIHFADRLSAALILFQGLEDKVVPPNQAETMADAARRKGLPVAYVPFEGEQHGFRKAENIIRSLEAELYFYGAVFGFTPADPLEPVAIDNLPR
ncbi:MAG TPA: prolyl oligopeptidase family serine peptidase [Vicinamibacterales bacterium]|nr:prolyl oligopeptidase family serine peptidase [Vicinamibacterales bacterium]